MRMFAKKFLATLVVGVVALGGTLTIAEANATSSQSSHTLAKKPAKKSCKKFQKKKKKNKKKYKKCIKRKGKSKGKRSPEPTPDTSPTPPIPTTPPPPQLTWVELYVDTAQMDKDGADDIVPDTFDLPSTCVGDFYLTAKAPQPTRADELYSPSLEYLLTTSRASVQVRRVGQPSGVGVNLNRDGNWQGTSTGDLSNGRQYGGRFILSVDSFYDDEGAHWSDYWQLEYSMSAQCTPDTTPRQL